MTMISKSAIKLTGIDPPADTIELRCDDSSPWPGDETLRKRGSTDTRIDSKGNCIDIYGDHIHGTFTRQDILDIADRIRKKQTVGEMMAAISMH